MSKYQSASFTFKDIGGEHVATFVGNCVVCGSRCFSKDNDEDPDPRGVIGPKHSAARLEAKDYNRTGPDVIMCYDCQQTRTTYEKGYQIGLTQWSEQKKAQR